MNCKNSLISQTQVSRIKTGNLLLHLAKNKIDVFLEILYLSFYQQCVLLYSIYYFAVTRENTLTLINTITLMKHNHSIFFLVTLYTMQAEKVESWLLTSLMVAKSPPFLPTLYKC